MRNYRFQMPVAELGPSESKNRTPVRRYWIGPKIIALMVALNGVLNLVSLMGRPIPSERAAWLHELLPLDFAGLSRWSTLLMGFSLILAAIHLAGRKRRAWQLAMGLAAGSMALHVTSRRNLGEAVCSAVMIAVLWFFRKQFPVGAAPPRMRPAVMRAVTAIGVACLYGTAGFWTLEPKEFHHNFRWWEASAHTVRIMLFLDGGGPIPQTKYAAWFVDSLFWMSAAAFLYCGVVLFRPVAYRFRLNARESALARDIAEAYGSSAQDFFKHWPDKSYFFSGSRRSFLGYRVANNYAVVLGDPVGPPEELERTIDDFVQYCQRQGWRVGFHQVGPAFLPIYESRGFRRLKVGDDALVDLARFSLGGSAMKEFRNTVNRLDRLGYRVERIEPPVPEDILPRLKEISDSWLEVPGHRERQFTLGRFEPAYVRSTPVYLVFDPAGQGIAFLNLAPSYRDGLATVDLMRRRPDAINGVMDYLFVKVFLDLKERGIESFSLGMAPLDGAGAPSGGPDQRVAHWFVRRMPSLFRTDSLRRFKAKYADDWMPRYAVYQSRFDLPRLALALRRVSELRGQQGRAA